MKKLIILFFAIIATSAATQAQTFNYVVSNDGNGYNINSTTFDTLTNITKVNMTVYVWIQGDDCHLEKGYTTGYEWNTTDYTEALRYAPKFAAIYVSDSLKCTVNNTNNNKQLTNKQLKTTKP